MNELLKPYMPLVDFLADYLGSNAEVLLHDLTNLEHSIVKIRNGHISGRKEGTPVQTLPCGSCRSRRKTSNTAPIIKAVIKMDSR